MNEYGRIALDHWTRWLPSRLSLIPEGQQRQSYFADLGDQVQEQIVAVEESLEAQASQELKTLPYLERMGRLNAIRSQAREQVLTEMVYLVPEQSALQTQDEPSNPEGPDDPLAEWMDSQGMPRDRAHHLWAMQEDERVSTEEFAAAARAWEETLWAQLRQQQ